jgi:ArsR family transcriptional regulator
MKKLKVLEQPCCVPGAPPLKKADADALAARFKALSDPARLTILNRIATEGETCTCLLTQPLGLSQPTVSHHLKVLKDAGLIEVAHRRGTWTFYRLVAEAMEQLAFTLGGAGRPEGVLVTRERAVAW